jgi:hypothetical protein
LSENRVTQALNLAPLGLEKMRSTRGIVAGGPARRWPDAEEASRTMKLVVKVLIFNLAILLGCIVAMLLAPSNTPSLLFFGCCALAFVAMNAWLFIIPRYRGIDQQKASKSHSSNSIAWWVIGAVLLANFLLKYGHRLFP